jgi:hypothetical protein
MDSYNSMNQGATTESGRVRSVVVLIAATAIIVLAASLLLLKLKGSDWKDEELIKNNPMRLVKVPDLPSTYLFDKSEDRYFLRPLNGSDWRPAHQAKHMKSEDPILGVYLKNKAWALPWWIIKNHHVANLTLDDQPVLITFCEVCSSGGAFNPVLNGQRYTFRIVGYYNGSILISDFETGSLWAPFSGEALHGPLKGTRMERLPLYQCTWAEWFAQHPESLVAYGAEALREGHGKSLRPGSGSPDELHANHSKALLRPPDQRLPLNELILGVEMNGQTRAYPISVLDKAGPVVNDTLGQQEIVVLHVPGTILAAAFSRRIGDEVLVFEAGTDGRIVDQKYRNHWKHTGEAMDGPLAGQKLSYVPSEVAEWYIWAAYHPETDIFDAGKPTQR